MVIPTPSTTAQIGKSGWRYMMRSWAFAIARIIPFALLPWLRALPANYRSGAALIVSEYAPREDADRNHDEKEHQQLGDDVVRQKRQDRLRLANERSARDHTPKVSDPAKDQHHVGIHGIREAHRRRNRLDRCENRSGDTGQSRAQYQ